MDGKELIKTLQERIVIADGAFGTQLHKHGVAVTECCDLRNIAAPEMVLKIHQKYSDAGAELLETNTFGANRAKLSRHGLTDQIAEINRKGAQLAISAAGENMWVAGAMGPIGRDSQDLNVSEKTAVYQEQAELLMEAGVHLLILETFNDLSELLLALSAVKKIDSRFVTAAQLVFTATGKTGSGEDALEAFLRLEQAGADIAGANCGIGPSGLLGIIKSAAQFTAAPVSVFANAGFPQRIDDRMIYNSDPEYLADICADMAESGAALIGGCCGTTPADISAIKKKIDNKKAVPKKPVSLDDVLSRKKGGAAAIIPDTPGKMMKKIAEREIVTVVELDPPKNLMFKKVLNGAQKLTDAGVDFISIAENPLAIARLSNISMAGMIQREINVETIVHLSGRDRNLIGTQSVLLGLAAEGIRHILAVTGDPPARGLDEKITGVYDLNSLKLISLINVMNQGKNYFGDDLKGRTAFIIGGAFNPDYRNWNAQANKLRKKIERGINFVQTQPVYSKEKIDKIAALRRELNIPILLGILPLVSFRNAEFLHNEFPGITIPDEIRDRLHRAGKEGEAEGCQIAWELIEYALDKLPGIYIMPPFNRYHLAVELLSKIKAHRYRHYRRISKRSSSRTD
jgi:homocysteine S-methyltransferase